MKRLMTFIAAILLTTVAAMAQHEEGYFTVQPKVGLNIATLSDADKAITDLHFGIEAEYMVTDNFSLGLGAILSNQGAKYDYYDLDNERYKYTVDLDYVHVPVLASFYVLPGLALKAGVQPGFRMKAKMKTGYKFTISKKITVKPKAATGDQFLANRQKLMKYIIANGYKTTDNFGQACYRLDTGVFRMGGSSSGWSASGEDYIIALPDYGEIKFYRTEEFNYPASGGDPQQLWEMGGYVTLDVNKLDDPFYECDITVTEGTGSYAEEIEDYYLLGYIDRVNFNPDEVASSVQYDDICGDYEDEDDCIYNANDFLSEMAWNWDDILAIYVEGLGLNMNKLGFPAM